MEKFKCHGESKDDCCVGCKTSSDVMDRHEKIVLQFSGGKDSMATLLFMRPWWNKINVMWVNTGAAFPEMIEFMDKIKSMVPTFTEVKTDQPAYIKQYGYPSDVVPIDNTFIGQIFSGIKENAISAYLDCCVSNISMPLDKATKATGATLIIRGQKNCDGHKSPIRNGHKEDGVEYFFPIQDWTNEEVFEFFKEQEFEVPEFYSLKSTSLDCWNCTAYCADHADKLSYMEKKHPEKFTELLDQLGIVRQSINKEVRHLDILLEKKHAYV